MARDFDTTVVYGKETTVDQIIEAAKRFPMMGAHQLIVVKEAQYLDRSIDQLAIIALHHNRSLYWYCATSTRN